MTLLGQKEGLENRIYFKAGLEASFESYVEYGSAEHLGINQKHIGQDHIDNITIDIDKLPGLIRILYKIYKEKVSQDEK